jgi:uncharacterized membrane protein
MYKSYKPSFKTEFIPLSLIIISTIASFYFYFNFPDQVAIHWNMSGQPDNWSSKGFAAFFFPFFILGLYLMLLFLPKVDPKKEKYKQFGKVYNIFKNIFILFMMSIYFLTSFNSLGYNVPIEIYMPVLSGILFIIIGNYMGKIKINWFLGIRTPWTLSSETVWNQTHRVGGKIFMLVGFILSLMHWWPENLQVLIFISIALIVFFGTFVYSYFLYKKEEKRNDKLGKK